MKINYIPEINNQQIKIEFCDEDLEEIITGGFVADSLFIGMEKFVIEVKQEVKGGLIEDGKAIQGCD